MSERMRALILAPFSDEALEQLRAFADYAYEDWRATDTMWDPEELGARLQREGFDVVIVERDFLFEETFAAAPRLRVAGICRAAINQVDVDAATERGVVVVNAPGRNAAAVAELTVAFMFALARRLHAADRHVRLRRWESPTEGYTDFRGVELGGSMVGVIGMGATGRKVATLCKAIGMRVLACDPFVEETVVTAAGAEPTRLEDLLRRADFVTLHAPPPPAPGAPLLSKSRLESMKPSAFLINTAAAELVDMGALVGALDSGRLAGAAFDVFETHPIEPSHPLLGVDNVILTPHLGGATEGTVRRHSASMVEDLRRFALGKRPRRLVNPEVWERRRA